MNERMAGLRSPGCWILSLLSLVLLGCPQLQSPDERARETIAAASDKGFSLPFDGGTLEVGPGKLQASSVSATPTEGGRLRVHGRISLEGRVDGLPVSYMGDERLQVICGRSCSLEGSPAQGLLDLLSVLRARRQALADGDREALAALVVPAAHRTIERADLAEAGARAAAGWFIRIDRDEALVGEALEGGGQRSLVLRREEAGWRFVSGLP